MTNKEWLDYLAHNAPDELSAWFDAERTESPTSDTMRHIGQVIENTVMRGVYGDTEPENEDSRERLEADIEEWASIMDLEDQIDMIHGWLNRRAAILEREMVKFNRRYFDCVEQEKKIAELQAQVDELKAERVKLRSQICKLEDDLVRTSDERNNWKANCEDWKNHARAAENACYETMLEREDYRKKFGKCIDYADAIHALMDDEGMA